MHRLRQLQLPVRAQQDRNSGKIAIDQALPHLPQAHTAQRGFQTQVIPLAGYAQSLKYLVINLNHAPNRHLASMKQHLNLSFRQHIRILLQIRSPGATRGFFKKDKNATLALC